jgi:amino acid transporter
MASDGLLFPIFGQVSSKSRTPIYSTLIGGLLAALMALFFDLLTLVEMLSIGTLIAYTQVALAVLISRYELQDEINPDLSQSLLSVIFIIVVLCFISIYSFEQHDFIHPMSFAIFTFLLGLLIYLVYTKLSRRRQNASDDVERVFRTPAVPWLPVLSIFCNVYLMLKLSFITWVRFTIWMFLGLSIYFFYGIHQAGKILFPLFI